MDARGRLARWADRLVRRYSKSEAPPQQLEDALDAIRGRLQGIAPETEEQWRFLHLAVERGTGVVRVAGRMKKARAVRLAFAVAMGVAVLFVGGSVLLRLTSPTAYETAKGRQSTITLRDGSEVVLNNSSELLVSNALFGRSRHVSLKGEAFFRVQRDGSPFTVSTDAGTIRVLGTEFNVRARLGALEVAVLRGSVRVSVDRNGVDSSVVVNTDQIVTCTRGSFPQQPAPLLYSGFPGWMHGKFMFYRTSLSSACEEIEERFDVVVRIRNPRLQDETITGVVDGQSVDSALTALTRLAGTTYRNEKGVYTLY